MAGWAVLHLQRSRLVAYIEPFRSLECFWVNVGHLEYSDTPDVEHLEYSAARLFIALERVEKSYLFARTDYFMHAEMLVKYRPYPTHPSLSTPSLFPPSLYRACAGVPAVVSGGSETLSQVWIIPG